MISRRQVLTAALTVVKAAPAAVGLGAAVSALLAETADAEPLGTLLDYSAGVLSAEQIRSAGARGAVRYVSDRRPGADWMLGKPLREAEASELRHNGLAVVSCYQYGKQATADWLGGEPAGVEHATRGRRLHTEAGGPDDAPIYAAIDDDPSYEQYRDQVAGHLRGWESVIGHQRTGIYANSKTIEWALRDGLGSWFWQHNYGSPGGVAHPAANLHQVEIDRREVGNVGVDVNQILTPQFGQWA